MHEAANAERARAETAGFGDAVKVPGLFPELSGGHAPAGPIAHCCSTGGALEQVPAVMACWGRQY